MIEEKDQNCVNFVTFTGTMNFARNLYPFQEPKFEPRFKVKGLLDKRVTRPIHYSQLSELIQDF